MTPLSSSTPLSRPAAGIVFVLAGVAAISVNDMLIKQLSGGYPLHQMIFVRSLIGLIFMLFFVYFEGGWMILKTRRPVLHLVRCVMVLIANMSFFTALAVVPLADATALFFVAPLLITLLSIPILGEKVGPRRLGAVGIGFCGVVLMMQPWNTGLQIEGRRVVLILPVIGAAAYAMMQVLTRKLGVASKASALAVYLQSGFLIVSIGFFLIAGDGRYSDSFDNASLRFLLRAWVWPPETDLYWFLALGLCSAVVGYSMSQAYRIADAATIAPFEYVGLPLAVFWGWLMFGELPGPVVFAGIGLIVGGGLLVFLREHQKQRKLALATKIGRR